MHKICLKVLMGCAIPVVSMGYVIPILRMERLVLVVGCQRVMEGSVNSVIGNECARSKQSVSAFVWQRRVPKRGDCGGRPEGLGIVGCLR